ncbi:hypothetical protein DFH08DRAFT_827898 [Mycena albidolilacea]|uniref:Uncharacterized protein n=1 Tax=Mycena albidolilacea TaxID=1033008 RepID=A0AAD6YXB6_9AGAR|nr:hypothetical protein DFH08DRAFT_827898 [Mycena albidolilacea]
MFHIVVWLFFLLVYSQAVRQPLERSTQQPEFDEWEVVMYTMALASLCEDINRAYIQFLDDRRHPHRRVRAARRGAVGRGGQGRKPAADELPDPEFCGAIVVVPNTLEQDDAPDGLWRVQLLSGLSLAFRQGLYAFHASNRSTDRPSSILNVLVQALLQSPDYDRFNRSPAGLMLYYLRERRVSITSGLLVSGGIGGVQFLAVGPAVVNIDRLGKKETVTPRRERRDGRFASDHCTLRACPELACRGLKLGLFGHRQVLQFKDNWPEHAVAAWVAVVPSHLVEARCEQQDLHLHVRIWCIVRADCMGASQQGLPALHACTSRTIPKTAVRIEKNVEARRRAEGFCRIEPERTWANWRGTSQILG